METVFIYALKDPRNGAVRYIGKSKNPEKRMRGHLRSKPGTHKAHWIMELTAIGITPLLEILDRVPETQWEFFECAYIKVYREAGAKLTNGTEGGDGISNPSREVREKISVSLSGEKNPNFGKHPSPEWCAAISAAKTGHRNSPEHCAAISAAQTGVSFTPERCAAVSARMKGALNHNFGKPVSEERRKKTSLALKGRKVPAEALANRRAALEARRERDKNVLQ